jgi:uncharacterized membrane protein YjgN (DUF898 family)
MAYPQEKESAFYNILFGLAVLFVVGVGFVLGLFTAREMMDNQKTCVLEVLENDKTQKNVELLLEQALNLQDSKHLVLLNDKISEEVENSIRNSSLINSKALNTLKVDSDIVVEKEIGVAYVEITIESSKIKEAIKERIYTKLEKDAETNSSFDNTDDVLLEATETTNQ